MKLAMIAKNITPEKNYIAKKWKIIVRINRNKPVSLKLNKKNMNTETESTADPKVSFQKANGVYGIMSQI